MFPRYLATTRYLSSLTVASQQCTCACAAAWVAVQVGQHEAGSAYSVMPSFPDNTTQWTDQWSAVT